MSAVGNEPVSSGAGVGLGEGCLPEQASSCEEVGGRRRVSETAHRGASAYTGACTETKDDRPPSLTPEQRTLADRHLGLVGVHLRTRVPTPRQPRRDREYEDLFQEGSMAVVRAAARYEPQRDGEFGSFVLPRIRGAVHAALRERFALIHVPNRAVARSRSEPSARRQPWQQPPRSLTDLSTAEMPAAPARAAGESTIRHVLRRRFERAVSQALEELGSRPWPRRNPHPIMCRLAAERLLISRESERMALRRIAREAGVSSGRASAYEQLLLQAVREHFAHDALVPILVRFAHEDAEGFDGALDARRRERLLEADLDAFESRFAAFHRAAQAELLFGLLERSTAAVTEVVCNLYRLCRQED